VVVTAGEKSHVEHGLTVGPFKSTEFMGLFVCHFLWTGGSERRDEDVVSFLLVLRAVSMLNWFRRHFDRAKVGDSN